MVLFYFLGVIFIIALVIYGFIYIDRQNDKKNLKNDWEKFLKSVSLNDVKGIALNGDKLIWNSHLKNDQLNRIINIVNSRVSDFPELEDLKNNAFNKKLHYDRPLPYPGSSGGKKQS
ncbi:hypothetical protein [Aurantibacter sp.]|uniref:hypothetical protein n=1 Tax=Aurantibacter sp. TaxID=2807103 RepID=UPI0035C7ED18